MTLEEVGGEMMQPSQCTFNRLSVRKKVRISVKQSLNKVMKTFANFRERTSCTKIIILFQYLVYILLSQIGSRLLQILIKKPYPVRILDSMPETEHYKHAPHQQIYRPEYLL